MGQTQTGLFIGNPFMRKEFQFTVMKKEHWGQRHI